jgi:cell division protein FtsW
MAASTRVKKTAEAKAYDYDWGLVTVVVAMLMLGFIMVFSASYPWAMTNYNGPFYFALKQLQWLVLGMAGMVVAALIPYYFWEKWSIPLMALGLIALMAVILVGNERLGATRTLMGGSVQPSEPVKIIVLIYISTWLASKGDRIRDVNYGLIPFGIVLGIVASLIVAQPDISTTVLIVATAAIVFFIAGAEVKQLLVGGAVAATTFWLVITRNEYAYNRVNAYLQSVDNPLNSNEWQIARAVKALIRGRFFGVGVGNSIEKLPGHLPLSWSDNIFAIIGEEMGLLGALLVILLFTLFAYRGFRIALHAPDTFGMLLATGITSLIVLQAMVHIAVVVAIAPPTGVTLPFISFGGSSLVTTMGATGILLSISRYGHEGAIPRALATRKPAYARLNFWWRDRGPRLSGTGRRPATRKSSSRTSRASNSRTRARSGRERTARTAGRSSDRRQS